jgi:lyso-ornithine lipid O-acyltransferase
MAELALSISESAWVELRRLWRAGRVVLHIFYGLLLAVCSGALWKPYRPLVTAIKRHWLVILLDIMAVRVEVRGDAPAGTTFVVSNHISWLDIPVIGLQHPVYFLSKAEVRDWPLIGLLARAVGTLFIRRGSGASSRKGQEIADHLRQGRDVLVFPEGTTTAGLEVKRFFPQLFVAPIVAGVAVQPLALKYLNKQGNTDPQLAFLGEDTFQGHLWQLLKRDQVRVQLRWGPLLEGETERDVLARRAHGAVSDLLRLI